MDKEPTAIVKILLPFPELVKLKEYLEANKYDPAMVEKLGDALVDRLFLKENPT